MDTTDFAINVLGFMGTGFSFLMWMPQARITWQSRNDAVRLAGISETTQWLLVLAYSVWGAYGVLSGSFWVAAPSAIAIPLAAATIVVIRRGRMLPDEGRSFPIFSSTDADPLATISDGLIALTESIPIIASSSDAPTDADAPVDPRTDSDPLGLPLPQSAGYTATGTIPILA
ncbi:uncharacterized protein with PQ loop repeat [Rhodoglobus vestalii]|uniref:Uncharacterized protein with PQ loop repeat n=1 Tax=Rhodoglobus vestalii TaxID=193384 RepID=A0A8H2K4K5_9MICO|nr:hypothetical protein [Rhodoglobus vestalii]TQO18777.1 uncharacterized protein with PQ loop repeat [Rhodoglobus vestalii]